MHPWGQIREHITVTGRVPTNTSPLPVWLALRPGSAVCHASCITHFTPPRPRRTMRRSGGVFFRRVVLRRLASRAYRWWGWMLCATDTGWGRVCCAIVANGDATGWDGRAARRKGRKEGRKVRFPFEPAAIGRESGRSACTVLYLPYLRPL